MDTILVLVMTLGAILFFVWVELNSRRNAREDKQSEAKPSASTSGATESGIDKLA
jgi:hypothetical protein